MIAKSKLIIFLKKYDNHELCLILYESQNESESGLVNDYKKWIDDEKIKEYLNKKILNGNDVSKILNVKGNILGKILYEIEEYIVLNPNVTRDELLLWLTENKLKTYNHHC